MDYKAGFIPFVVENGEPVFAFMVPSKPPRGDTSPAIAKGSIEPWENEWTAAIREAYEELGMNSDNLVDGSISAVDYRKVDGSKTSFFLTTLIGELQDRSLGNFCSETKSVIWLTYDEFRDIGRRTHRPIVRVAYDKAILWIEKTGLSI